MGTGKKEEGKSVTLWYYFFTVHSNTLFIEISSFLGNLKKISPINFFKIIKTLLKMSLKEHFFKKRKSFVVLNGLGPLIFLAKRHLIFLVFFFPQGLFICSRESNYSAHPLWG